MPALLLIRHGQASYGAGDYDVLSETGVRQAELVHAALRERGVAPARLVCGSLRRQRDTAAPWEGDPAVDARWDEYDAADVLRTHSETEASLERPVGPDGEPVSSRDFQAVLDRALLAWIAAGEDGGARETWPAFRARTVAAAQDLAGALRSGQTAVAFTSGGVIAAVAAAVLELPDDVAVALNHVAVNGAYTKLVSGRRGISLISFNEHGHLEREGLLTYR